LKGWKAGGTLRENGSHKGDKKKTRRFSRKRWSFFQTQLLESSRVLPRRIAMASLQPPKLEIDRTRLLAVFVEDQVDPIPVSGEDEIQIMLESHESYRPDLAGVT